MRALLITLFVFVASLGRGQESCNLRISLLTCAPGEELYSTFGHTAIRVQDSLTGTDQVFNYGTFEFSPDFYSKFIRGKLLYYLSIDDFRNFLYSYQYESRSVVEQELVLSCAEKRNLLDALYANARIENRYYLYDFLFDNCTTRAKEMIERSVSNGVLYGNIIKETNPTFRNLIHHYLDLGGQYWSKLGIDILLGAKLDRKVSNQEAMFLPDELLKGMNTAKTGRQQLVEPVSTVLKMPSPLNSGSLFRPWIVFSLLALIVIGASFSRNRTLKRSVVIFDRIFFLLLGLAGLLLLFMWFGTDHKVTANNYNLLWALPTHAVVAFVMQKDKSWIRYYFRSVFLLTILFLAGWVFLPQQINTSLLPLIILVIFRSSYHANWKS